MRSWLQRRCGKSISASWHDDPGARDPWPHRPLRGFPGAVRHRHGNRAGRDHRHHRRQRRRQINLSQGHCRTGQSGARQRAVRGQADRRAWRRQCAQARNRDGAGGAAAIPVTDRRGKSVDRQLRSERGGSMVARQHLCTVSRPEGPPRRAEPDLVRRRAADGGDRARADVEPARAALRRDQPRPGADRDPQHLRRDAAHQGRTAPASCWSSRTSSRR